MTRLIEPLIPALRRYARSLMRDRSAADDLVQDCLERAITRWHQHRPDSDARAWLFSILHNLAVSGMRQQARRGPHVALEDIASSSSTHEDGLRFRELLRALDTLPEEQRTVLLLVSVEDLSYGEASQVLNIPIGTVMSRVARARDKLLKATSGDPSSATSSRPTLRRVK